MHNTAPRDLIRVQMELRHYVKRGAAASVWTRNHARSMSASFETSRLVARSMAAAVTAHSQIRVTAFQIRMTRNGVVSHTAGSSP